MDDGTSSILFLIKYSALRPVKFPIVSGINFKLQFLMNNLTKPLILPTEEGNSSILTLYISNTSIFNVFRCSGLPIPFILKFELNILNFFKLLHLKMLSLILSTFSRLTFLTPWIINSSRFGIFSKFFGTYSKNFNSFIFVSSPSTIGSSIILVFNSSKLLRPLILLLKCGSGPRSGSGFWMRFFIRVSFFKFVNASSGKLPNFPSIFKISKFVNLLISSGKVSSLKIGIFKSISFKFEYTPMESKWLKQSAFKNSNFVRLSGKVKLNGDIEPKLVRVNFFKLTYFSKPLNFLKWEHLFISISVTFSKNPLIDIVENKEVKLWLFSITSLMLLKWSPPKARNKLLISSLICFWVFLPLNIKLSVISFNVYKENINI